VTILQTVNYDQVREQAFMMVLDTRCQLCPKRHTYRQHLANIDKQARRAERLVRSYQAAVAVLMHDGTHEQARSAALEIARTAWDSANGDRITNCERLAS
jgi:uncharacterized membrane protein